MKKVLLGLVIAVMMTGSGYTKSNDLPERYCEFLKDQAFFYTELGYVIRENALKNNLPNQDAMDGIKDNIKSAHYYAVTWSALCD